jgi:hypothetical protein
MSMGSLWKVKIRLPNVNAAYYRSAVKIRNQQGQPTMFCQSLYKYVERLQHHMHLKRSHD